MTSSFAKAAINKFCSTVTVLLLGPAAAMADFCGDLNAMFARAGNFAAIRGPVQGDRLWRSKIGFAGADECNIQQDDKDVSNLFLACTLKKYEDKRDADKAYATLVAQAKKCAPESTFTYMSNEMEIAKSFFFFDRSGKRSGNVLLNEVPDLKFENGKAIQIKTWWLNAAVYKARQN